MRRLFRWPAATLLAAAVGASAVQTDSHKPATQQRANPDAVVLEDFRERVDKYLQMHQEVNKGAARLKETDDPAKIREAQLALAARIRAARKDARPGDIFSAQIRALFRRLLYPELQGPEGRETKSELKEDAPKSVPLRVNAAYPEGVALPDAAAESAGESARVARRPRIPNR
jgi:hypothetical protein